MEPSASSVDLPPDVESDEEVVVSDHSQNEELPPDVLSDGEVESPSSQHCSCKLQCSAKFATADVQVFRDQQLADENRKIKAFEKIKALVAKMQQSQESKIPWAIDSERVCRPFWEHYFAIGHKQVDDMVKLAKAGHLELPGRGARMPKSHTKLDIVDIWFLHLYQGSSEPVPVEGSADRLEDVGPDCLQHEIVSDIHHPIYALTVAVGNGENAQHVAPKRYLNETDLTGLWNLYSNDDQVEQKVSRDTFTKAFKRHWQKLLNFKHADQGNRCQVCADLDEERRNLTTKSERQHLDVRKQLHLDRCEADRSINVRGNALSSNPATFKLANSSTSVMKIMIDGMDQAKFRCPRNLASSSAFSQVARPALHLTGVLAFGLLETFYILGPDTKKDANMNATCVAAVLDQCQIAVESMGADHALPRHLIVSADNTPREAKNQFFATFMAMLIANNQFDTIEVQYLQVGHTKSELDQRFSSLATILSKAPVLETPEAFRNWLTRHIRPVHGKMCLVELLDETWDFSNLVEKFGMQISGLTATHLQPNANHSWRFEKRMTLEPSTIVNTHNPEWQDLPPHDNDVVLTVKQFLGTILDCFLCIVFLHSLVNCLLGFGEKNF